MTPLGLLGFLPEAAEGETIATIVPWSTLSSSPVRLVAFSTDTSPFFSLGCTLRSAMVSSNLVALPTPEKRTPNGVPFSLSTDSLVVLVGVALRALAGEGEDDVPGSSLSSRE